MSVEKPKVSVCIPNYNYGHFIRSSIQSVLDQTYQDFELIIVDDSSTDNSESVVKSFSDNRIKFYNNERNIGLVKNLNRCLCLASGQYVSILHGDDIYLPQALEKRVSSLDSNPSVGLVYSQYKIIDENGAVIGEYRYCQDDYIAKGEDEFKTLILKNHIGCPTVMVRKECYDKLGGYDERYPQPSDWEMWLRIALHYDVAFISEPLVCYRVHQTNLTNKFLEDNTWGMEHYRMVKGVFSGLPAERKHLCYLEQQAVKEIAKRVVHQSISSLKIGNSGLARRNIALAVAIDSSCLKNMDTYGLFISTLLGRRGAPLLFRGKGLSVLRKINKLKKTLLSTRD